MNRKVDVIERIEKHAKLIASGKHDEIRPGMPLRISTAAQAGDGVWQGDLGLELIEKVPKGYKKAKNPSLQLVPGNTQGAKHCLDSLQGVEVYLPKGWGTDFDSLEGPCLVLSEERTVLHPTHGDVTIPKDFVVLCRYQRNYDADERREHRAID